MLIDRDLPIFSMPDQPHPPSIRIHLVRDREILVSKTSIVPGYLEVIADLHRSSQSEPLIRPSPLLDTTVMDFSDVRPTCAKAGHGDEAVTVQFESPAHRFVSVWVVALRGGYSLCHLLHLMPGQ